MQRNTNYIKQTPIILLMTIVLLSIVSLYRGGTIAGVEIKRSNIYRDITPKKESVMVAVIDTTTTITQIDTMVNTPTNRAQIESDSVVDIASRLTDSKITLIEDYSKNSGYISLFREGIKNAENSEFRLAFLGDSYIEGDILTMDLRSKLQQKFGGGGVGFVPITSVVSKYRTSVKHTFSDNWSSKSAIKQPSDGDYILSGYKFFASENSFVEYKMSSVKKRLNSVNRSTLLYLAEDSAKVKVVVNGKNERYYDLPKSNRLQSITISDSNIKSIYYEFENCSKLTLYGAMHDQNKGVSVDNFSLRGEMGNLPNIISQNCIKELNSIVQYGLIVLQYGLNFNAINKDNQFEHHYKIIENGVERLKKSYPNTPILIMGIGPVMSRDDDGLMVIKENIYRIEQMQRDVARNTGAMFWSTIDAVDKLGGMEQFVDKRWASKDYTHITSLGGEKLAGMLYKALIEEDVIEFTE